MNFNSRTEKNKVSIMILLKEICDLKQEVVLWQQTALGRIIHRAFISQIQNNQIVIESPFEIFNGFTGKETLYFHSDHRQVTFKVKNFQYDKNKVILPIPTEIKAIELRKIPRIILNQDFTTPELAFFKNRAFEAGTKEFSFKLHDISEFGLSFIIPRGGLPKFAKGDELFFDQLGECKFEKIVKGTIRHISPLIEGETFSNSYYKVGVQFDRIIPLDNLQFLKAHLKD